MPKTNSFSFCNCILKQRKFVFCSGDVTASFSKAFTLQQTFRVCFYFHIYIECTGVRNFCLKLSCMYYSFSFSSASYIKVSHAISP